MMETRTNQKQENGDTKQQKHLQWQMLFTCDWVLRLFIAIYVYFYHIPHDFFVFYFPWHVTCACMWWSRFILSFIRPISAVVQGRFYLGASEEIAFGALNHPTCTSRMFPCRRKLYHLLGTLHFFKIQDTKLKRAKKQHLVVVNQRAPVQKLLHHGPLKSRSGTAVVYDMYSKSGSSSNINNSICFVAFLYRPNANRLHPCQDFSPRLL